MKIKKRFFNFGKTAVIDIESIKINYDKLLSILKILKFDEIVVVVDSVENQNEIFCSFEDAEITYSSLEKSGVGFSTIIMLLDLKKIEILKTLIEMKTDLYIFENSSKTKLSEYIEKFNSIYNKLIAENYSQFVIDCVLNEQYISVYLNSENYNSDDICRTLKNFFS